QSQAQTAESGNCPGVDAPELVGPINGTDPARDLGDEWRGQYAAHHRQREDHQVTVGDHHEPGPPPCRRSSAPRFQRSRKSASSPGLRKLSSGCRSFPESTVWDEGGWTEWRTSA